MRLTERVDRGDVHFPGRVRRHREREGRRVEDRRVDAGAVKSLPDGWKVELVEKDHAYNPQQSVQLYKEIKDQVLWLATSFGTPPTMPLLEDLKRDDMIAYPASLSSAMAANENTPPL